MFLDQTLGKMPLIAMRKTVVKAGLEQEKYQKLSFGLIKYKNFYSFFCLNGNVKQELGCTNLELEEIWPGDENTYISTCQWYLKMHEMHEITQGGSVARGKF